MFVYVGSVIDWTKKKRIDFVEFDFFLLFVAHSEQSNRTTIKRAMAKVPFGKKKVQAIQISNKFDRTKGAVAHGQQDAFW